LVASAHGAGNTTPALRATPPKRGISPAPGVRDASPEGVTLVPRNLRPNPRPIPLLGGVRPQAGGGFPRRTQPSSKPPYLTTDH
jgi:hypothetical protein